MPKILIAEDDRFLSAAYNTKLTKTGYETKNVSNGEDAMSALKDFHPDLIILDLIMPIKDGFSVLEDLKKDSNLSKIPVLVFTNLGQKEDQDKVLALGAKAYMVKSDTTPEQLLEKIKELI